MKFLKFAQYLQKIENTPKRLEMTYIMVELIKELEIEETEKAAYLLTGRLAPLFVPLEFNFSKKLILRSLSSLLDFLNPLSGEKNSVEKLYLEKGDCGLVAEELLKENTSTDLTISNVFSKLEEIANCTGKGSVELKINLYITLLQKLDYLSAKFVTRIIEGNIRLGLSDKTLLDAFSWYVTGDKSIREIFDMAYGKRPDIGFIAKQVKTLPREKLLTSFQEMKIAPFAPVASKLVERELNSQKSWERLSNPIVQPKLDGLRGQLHFKNGIAKIFSRNMEEMTIQFPEICLELKSLNVDSIILDSEIIGFNFEQDKYRTYQETMKRKRKYEISGHAESIPVCAMCFDILYLNGEDLTALQLKDRLNKLKEILKVDLKNIKMLETKEITTAEELEEYYLKNIKSGLEGIIIKDKESIYEPGTRNFKWIKLKANAKTEMVDTIDVAVMGFYGGKGDRAQFGFGALLVGVLNEDDGKYYSIGKVGSGFKEEEMKTMLSDMKKLEINGKEIPEMYVVSKQLFPDSWIEPKIIAEIIADEITRSPAHTAAVGIKTEINGDSTEKGLSIRFPRLKKWKRDKLQPTTVKEIIRMYYLRKEGHATNHSAV